MMLNDTSDLQPMYFFGYITYFKHLLENKMKPSTFNRMIKTNERSKTFRIRTDSIYQYKLMDELDNYMTLSKPLVSNSSVFDCLKKQYGTIAQINFPKNSIRKNPELKEISNWIDINSKEGFLSRFKFSSLLPYIFLDVQSDDSILSCGSNIPQICEIISDSLNEGYFFINEIDEKSAKTNYHFNHNNYCVISYPVSNIPDIQTFDKVLCIAPSTEDGSVFNNSSGDVEFTLDKAIENHKKQKLYLISSLEKLKLGGICVYATFSLNPFENEAVVNSVLQVKQFKDKFEIVDCSSLYPDIRRKKGFDSWDLNSVPNNITNNELLESLSSNSLFEGIDKCMRFYPHQINCCGTFVAVIRKIKEIDEKTKMSNQCEPLYDIKFTQVKSDVNQKIIKDFGLPDKCNEIHFVLKDTTEKKELYQLNTRLYDILCNYGLDKLRLSQAGCLGYTLINQECDVPFIPSIQTLPSYAKAPSKSYIKINDNDFKTIINFGIIYIKELSMKNQAIITANKTGGVYIMLENKHGTLLGGYLNEGSLKVLEAKEDLNKLYKIVKEEMPQKTFQKKIPYFLNRLDETDKKIDNVMKKLEEISKIIFNKNTSK